MKAVYKRVKPYQKDAMNLPVANVEEAYPYYETYLGFKLQSKTSTPVPAVVLERDGIQFGLAENGGDSSQDGCFFEVDSVVAAFTEIKANGLQLGEANFRIDKYGETTYKVFFVIAPDGLCYCLGEKQP